MELVFGVIGLIGMCITIAGFFYSIKVHCYQLYLGKCKAQGVLNKIRQQSRDCLSYIQNFDVKNLHSYSWKLWLYFCENKYKIELFLDKKYINDLEVLVVNDIFGAKILLELRKNKSYFQSQYENIPSAYEMAKREYRLFKRLLELNPEGILTDEKRMRKSIILFENLMLNDEGRLKEFIFKYEELCSVLRMKLYPYKNIPYSNMFIARERNIIKVIYEQLCLNIVERMNKNKTVYSKCNLS